MPLGPKGLEAVCDAVKVDAAEIWSVVFTETDPPYGGYWSNGSPQILYEQHVFSRLTKGRFDASHPDISNREPGNYGAKGSHQYARLSEAAACDLDAALKSASWGIGQTLGTNYAECGYASVQDLVADMFVSEDRQLMAAANEMIQSGCAQALRNHDWPGFARIYNGKNYAKNHYDEKLRSRYAELIGHEPDLSVRTAQVYLIYLGFNPGPTDGLWGKRTADAVLQYQTRKGLPASGRLDAATVDRLEAEAKAWLAALPAFVI
jgi:hypothetical protein